MQQAWESVCSLEHVRVAAAAAVAVVWMAVSAVCAVVRALVEDDDTADGSGRGDGIAPFRLARLWLV